MLFICKESLRTQCNKTTVTTLLPKGRNLYATTKGSAYPGRGLRYLRTGAFVFAVLCMVCGKGARGQASPRPNVLLPSPQTALRSASPADSDLQKAEALIESGKLADAEQGLRACLSSHTASADGHFLLGYVLYREQKPKDSLAEYTQGAKYRKPGAEDLAVVAMDYILLGDFADADKWLTQAVRWKPKDALYWYYLGRTKYSENRFQEAIGAFKQNLSLVPRDVRAEYNLGLSYEGLGDTDDALSAFRAAIAWQANAAGKQDAQPYLDLGMLLMQQGHAEEAVPHLQKAVELNDQNPRAHEELGRVYERLHNLLGAQVELQKAITLAPKVSALHFELGRIYQMEGLHAQAQSEFERCAALNGDHSTDAAETPNPDVRR